MATFYDRMKGISKRLIDTYGTSSSIIGVNDEVLSSQNGVAGVVKAEDYANTLVEKAETVVYIADPSIIPDTTHYFLWNGELYKIIYVNTYKPGPTTVLYGLYIRK